MQNGVCRKWVMHNDATVREVSFEDIKNDIERNAYIVFYEKT